MSDEEDEQTNINNNNRQDSVELYSSSEFNTQLNDKNAKEDAINEDSDNDIQRYVSSEQMLPESPLINENVDNNILPDDPAEQPAEFELPQLQTNEDDLSKLHQLLDSDPQQIIDDNNNENLDEVIQDNAAEPPPESDQPQVSEEAANEDIDIIQQDDMELPPPPPPPPPPPADFLTEAENVPFVPVGGIQLIPGEMPKLRKVEKKEEPEEQDSDSDKPVDFATFKEKLNNILSAQVNQNTNQEQQAPVPIKQLIQIHAEEEIYKNETENDSVARDTPSAPQPEANEEEVVIISDEIDNNQIQEETAEPPPESEQPQVSEEAANEDIDNMQQDDMELPPPPPPPPPPADFLTEAENVPFVPVGGIQLIPGEMPKLRKVEKKEEPEEQDSDSDKPVDFATFKEKLNNILSAQVNQNTNQEQQAPVPIRELVQIHKEEILNRQMAKEAAAVNENLDPNAQREPVIEKVDEVIIESAPNDGVIKETEVIEEIPQTDDVLLESDAPQAYVIKETEIIEEIPQTNEVLAEDDALQDGVIKETEIIEEIPQTDDVLLESDAPQADVIKETEIIEEIPQTNEVLVENDALQDGVIKETEVIEEIPQTNEVVIVETDAPQAEYGEEKALEDEINDIMNIFMHDEEAVSLPPPEPEVPQANEAAAEVIIEHDAPTNDTIIETRVIEEIPPDQQLQLAQKKLDSFQNALAQKLKERKENLENNPIPIEQMPQKKAIELQRLEDQINRLTKTKNDNIFSSHGSM
ncbi:hypothetical protein M9Y10_006968 [Tritrichomonas musculus]|uniref:Uncharacterized protein n=1 Tax=Tritrichomonas musculus TaxID=1915356 RepID=A0ABR2J204_9EUKA